MLHLYDFDITLGYYYCNKPLAKASKILNQAASAAVKFEQLNLFVMRYFLCFIFPPLAVLSTGRIGAFILSIILTICFWIPGVIHAVLVTNDFYDNRRNRRVVRAIRAGRYYY